MVQRHLGHACSHFACCLFCSSPCVLSDENIASLSCAVTMAKWIAAGSPSGSHMVATSRRLKWMSGSKKSMPSNTLIRNRSIIAGTHIPDTTGARAIAGHIWHQSMQTPTVYMYPKDDGWSASRELPSVPPGLSSTRQSSWQPLPDTSAPMKPWVFNRHFLSKPTGDTNCR